MLFIEFEDSIRGRKLSIRADTIVGFQPVARPAGIDDLQENERPSAECCEIFTSNEGQNMRSEWLVGHTYEEVRKTLKEIGEQNG